jgi:hypothetical protein
VHETSPMPISGTLVLDISSLRCLKYRSRYEHHDKISAAKAALLFESVMRPHCL